MKVQHVTCSYLWTACVCIYFILFWALDGLGQGLIGASMPRPATVRAKTDVEATALVSHDVQNPSPPFQDMFIREVFPLALALLLSSGHHVPWSLHLERLGGDLEAFVFSGIGMIRVPKGCKILISSLSQLISNLPSLLGL